ncbi:MAG: DUF4215 domain-containing protein [Gammaproteobacteria bacterium]
MNRVFVVGAVLALFSCTGSAHARFETLFGDGPLCGNGLPDPGEECDDGNVIDGDGCSSTCQLDSGQYFCTDPVPASPDINAFPDGSFENSNLNGEWAIIEHSLFARSICGDDCFGAPLASDLDGNLSSGNFVLVSGGSFVTASSGVVEHSPVVIPAGATALNFNYGIGAPGGICPAPDDGLRLYIDGALVWSSVAPGQACEGVNVYTVVDVDISPYADGASHVIRFEGTSSINADNTALANIFLDQVRLLVPPPDPQPPTPSQCFLLTCGDGIHTPDEQCDDGNVVDGDGCSASCEIEQPNFVCAEGVLPAPNFNVVTNGGFELGDDASWTFAGPGDEPLCSQALCQLFNPLTDAFYAWFRGATFGAERTMTQTLTLPTTASTLFFELDVLGPCDDSGDTLSVLMDGVDLYSRNCTTAPTGNTVTIDVSAFADGAAHTLTFRHTATSDSNFIVDNVRINANAARPGQPSLCSELAPACSAPETFDAGIPADWTIVNLGADPAAGWGTSDDGVCGSNFWSGGNVTGGGGAAACADSDAQAQAMDTYLCTPALNPASVTQPQISFLVNYQANENAADANDQFDVLVGTVPPNPLVVPNFALLDSVIDHLGGYNLTLSPAGAVSLDLTPVASETEAYVCFRYQGERDWFAQIDNVALRGVVCDAPADQDFDGIPDGIDNCTQAANASQLDTDGDGYGNRCDADFNDDCVVNAADLGIFRTLFFTPNSEADLDGNGITGIVDLGIFRTLFFGTPGPSASGSCGP